VSTPVVSVVVPCYRPGEVIDRCVDALLRQELDVPYEVIVVESSGDGTAERLCRRFSACRVIALGVQTAQAAARNLGIAEARGSYIALTDHDCLVPPDWIARLLARHETGHYSAVGGAVANGTPGSTVGTAAYWIEFNDFTMARPGGPIAGTPHCNVCFRRDALEGAAPFPAVRPCAEDLTFNYRLTQGGGTIYFDPAIVVTHLNRTRLRDYLAHQHALGAGSAAARRLVPLPGTVFVRHPTLAPLLPALRLAGTLSRVTRRHPSRLPVLLALLPILLPGYIAWTAGFLKGRREPVGASSATLPTLLSHAVHRTDTTAP
jgi:glycosyltransferase involved in cell wall biosynthesis